MAFINTNRYLESCVSSVLHPGAAVLFKWYFSGSSHPRRHASPSPGCRPLRSGSFRRVLRPEPRASFRRSAGRILEGCCDTSLSRGPQSNTLPGNTLPDNTLPDNTLPGNTLPGNTRPDRPNPSRHCETHPSLRSSPTVHTPESVCVCVCTHPGRSGCGQWKLDM